MKQAFRVLAALAALAWLAGCGGAKEQTAEGTAQDTPAATPEAGTTAGDGAAGTVEATPGQLAVPTETAQASLNGKLGCGHCTFHVKESCTLALKTDAGEVYVVEAGERQEELFGKRYDEPAVLIAGRVADVDGQKVIYAESVELR